MLRVFSLSLSLDQGIECLGFWFSQDFLSLSARELNAEGFGSLRIFSPSLGQGIECLGSWFSQGSLSLSLSLYRIWILVHPRSYEYY
jgi:hypothetical protein